MAISFTYIFTLKCHIQSYAISTEPWDDGYIYPAHALQTIVSAQKSLKTMYSNFDFDSLERFRFQLLNSHFNFSNRAHHRMLPKLYDRTYNLYDTLYASFGNISRTFRFYVTRRGYLSHSRFLFTFQPYVSNIRITVALVSILRVYALTRIRAYAITQIMMI